MDLGFIIDDYQEMDVFAPMVEINFNKFFSTMMRERVNVLGKEKRFG
jgi:hypothetical protein